MKILNRFTGELILEIDILQHADLWGVNLQDANLQDANFQYANLQDANFQYANLQDANLQYADLQYANLKDANLQGASLQGADLQGADLQGADLQGADLRGANLQYANLQDANLQDANLQSASLWGVVGNMQEIKSMQIDKYPIAYTNNRLQIGCKNYSFYEWETFSDGDISTMDDDALDWWKIWKPIIMQIVKM